MFELISETKTVVPRHVLYGRRSGLKRWRVLPRAKLPDLRERLGMTQEQFAKLLRVGRDAVTSWESGRKRMDSIGALVLLLLHRAPVTMAARVKAIAAAKDQWLCADKPKSGRYSHLHWGTVMPSEVRQLRKTLGMEQKAFAAFLGVGVASVKTWESGRGHPNAIGALLLRLLLRNPYDMRARIERLHARGDMV